MQNKWTLWVSHYYINIIYNSIFQSLMCNCDRCRREAHYKHCRGSFIPNYASYSFNKSQSITCFLKRQITLSSKCHGVKVHMTQWIINLLYRLCSYIIPFIFMNPTQYFNIYEVMMVSLLSCSYSRDLLKGACTPWVVSWQLIWL